jgi:hypothetical protein
MKRLRVENNVEKSDENDAMIPAKMPKACFKELTIRDVTLLRLIDGYEKSARWRRVIRQWMESYPLNSFEKCVRKLRSMHDFYGRKIIEEVMRDEDYAAIYRMVCEELGLKDSVEVAILVAMLPLNWKLRRVKGLLGLTLHKSKNYHHKLREHLSKLAATIYINNGRHGVGARLFESINRVPRDKALYTLQLRMAKILKRAWQQQQKQCILADGLS